MIENNARVSKHRPYYDQRQLTVCIITPTYNEASNITKLLDRIYEPSQIEEYRENHITIHVLVVDDSSPDGTASVVMDYRKENHNVHLLVRSQKNGLGAAYISGMQHALSVLSPDIIFEMDADLSHDPEYIMDMILGIVNGADFVIGSRYVPGGSLPVNWGWSRRMISKSANTYARTVLGIKDVKDCTGGFRAMRSSALKEIDLDSLNVKGYMFQISLLDAMIRNRKIVREVPIAFRERNAGKSKMRLKDIAEVALVVLKMAFMKRPIEAMGKRAKSVPGTMSDRTDG